MFRSILFTLVMLCTSCIPATESSCPPGPFTGAKFDLVDSVSGTPELDAKSQAFLSSCFRIVSYGDERRMTKYSRTVKIGYDTVVVYELLGMSDVALAVKVRKGPKIVEVGFVSLDY